MNWKARRTRGWGAIACAAALLLAATEASAITSLTIISGGNGTGTQDANLTADGIIAEADADSGGNTLSTGALAAIGSGNNISITVAGPITFSNGISVSMQPGAAFSASFSTTSGAAITANAATIAMANGGSLTLAAAGSLSTGTLTTQGGNISLQSSSHTLAGPITSNGGNLSIQTADSLAVAQPIATGAGSITINLGSGLRFTNQSSITTSNNVSVRAVQYDLQPGSSITTNSSSEINLRASTAGVSVNLGAITDSNVDLSAAELGTITAGRLRLSAAASTTVSAPISLSTVTTLFLESISGFSQDPSATVTVDTLGISSASASFISGNDVGTLAVNISSSGGVTFADANSLTVGPVFSLSGISARGPISLSTVGAMTVAGPLIASAGGSGGVTLSNGGVLSITANGDITADGPFLQNGAGVVETAGDISTGSAANNLTFTTGVTLTGNVSLSAGTGSIRFDAPLNLGTRTATLTASDTRTSNLALNVNGTSAGQFGRLLVNGPIDISGDTLTLNSTGGIAGGAAIAFIDNDGSDAIVGTFSGIAEGATVNAGAQTFRLSYVGGTGNDGLLTARAAPLFTSGSGTTFTAGSPGNFLVSTSGFPVAAIGATGSLPTGVTLVDNGNGTATLSGTPAAGTGGSYALTLSAGNGISPDASQSFSLTVLQAPTITSANATTFTVGTAGSFTVTTSGFPSAALSRSGTLPSGISFVNNGNGTATLSGTPAAGSGGTYPLTLVANNAVAPIAAQSFTLTVNQAPAITSAAATIFTAGTAGSFTVTTTGFPTAGIASAGTLPSGVTFSDNGNGTATLAGTPAAGSGGSYALTLTASNGVAPNATQAFLLSVNEAPAITSANATTFTTGSAGSFTVTTTGVPSAAITHTGLLPAGVSLTDNGNGTATLAGTPPAGSGGSYPLTLTASNGVNPVATQAFTLTVNQAPAITSAASAAFSVGAAGSFTVTATGFPAVALNSAGSLPAGVSFSDNGNGTATISGTPAAGTGGSYPLTLTASNGVNPVATQSFTLSVNQGAAISSGTATTFSAGSAGSFTFTGTGTPAPRFSLSGTLPTGLVFSDAGNGAATLAGTPAARSGGVYPLTVIADNGTATSTQAFTLTVNEAPSITSPAAANFSAGARGQFTVTTVGFPAPALTVAGALPAGVSLIDNGNGTATLSGTPAAGSGGTYPLTFTASNGLAPSAAQGFTLTVGEVSAIPVSSLPSLLLLLLGLLATAVLALRTHRPGG